MASLKLLLAGIIFSVSSFFGASHSEIAQQQMIPQRPIEQQVNHGAIPSTAKQEDVPVVTTTQTTTSSTVTTSQMAAHVYSDEELLAMADNTYANGEVPLGDGKYTTSGPKKGYVYLCNVRKENFGSDQNGPWVHGTTWNFLSKLKVSGSVSWSNATFSNVISGAYRILSGNDLPINHTTGTYPIASSDEVSKYDRNPNSISAQAIKQSIPADPTYSNTPYCMGGEAGIMLSGVALFDALDAPLRDAPAHEAQDSCGGHPQESGEYHYHSLSPCFKDISVKTVLGYAYDGFPITGPQVAKDKYLTTDDLDECHGLTSEITVDGKKKTTYHYVMTQDYPYSVSCFRGKPVTTGPSAQFGTRTGSAQQQQTQAPQQGGGMTRPEPPQEAKTACTGKTEGGTCSVGGQMSGTCENFGSYLACIPSR